MNPVRELAQCLARSLIVPINDCSPDHDGSFRLSTFIRLLRHHDIKKQAILRNRGVRLRIDSRDPQLLDQLVDLVGSSRVIERICLPILEGLAIDSGYERPEGVGLGTLPPAGPVLDLAIPTFRGLGGGESEIPNRGLGEADVSKVVQPRRFLEIQSVHEGKHGASGCRD